jgi:DNA-binding LytR/AlgR family response regulator
MIPANPTAIVADDEPLLRARLVSLLSMTWPQLTILPQAQNGREAVELCETHRPDIAFLDIRMPLISGIDVARMLPSSTRVVFVTAYDEYAVRAFEAGAADYLIKPIEPARLSATVDRLKASLHQASIKSRDMEAFLAELSAKIRPEQPKFLEWIRASVGQAHSRRRYPLLSFLRKIYPCCHFNDRSLDTAIYLRPPRRARAQSIRTDTAGSDSESARDRSC